MPDTKKQTRVLIVGDHPWKDHAGHLHSVNGKVKVIRPLGSGPEMVEIELDNGQRCFAERKHLRLL